MDSNFLRARVLARERLLGCFLTWPTAGVLELLGLAGFDFVVVDTEHGYFNTESVEQIVRAAEGAPIPVIVRVPSCLAAADAGRALDAGACGVLFPRADSEAPVRAAVENVKFAPVGHRGLAGVRANRYGAVPFDDWVLEANEGSTVFVQIETAGALDELEPIAALQWVDLLFVGPNDLSQALGVPGHYEEPRYRAAVERVGAVAREHGKAAGIMLRAPDEIPALTEHGYRVFTTSDRTLFSQSARAWRAALGGRNSRALPLRGLPGRPAPSAPDDAGAGQALPAARAAGRRRRGGGAAVDAVPPGPRDDRSRASTSTSSARRCRRARSSRTAAGSSRSRRRASGGSGARRSRRSSRR